MATVPAPSTPARTRGAPQVVVLSTALWLGAILAGIVESLVRLAGPLPPTTAELLTRGGVYLALAVLVLGLPSGRAGVRWTVLLVLGVLGTLSLVVEPVRALLDGASVAGFLTAASGPELLAAALRALHVVEVAAAAALLFHPVARRFFRPGPPVRAVPGGAYPTPPVRAGSIEGFPQVR